MNRINWPTALVLVLGGLPALVFLTAVLCAYPVPVLCFSAGAGLFILGDRISRRHTALADRAAIEYQRNAAMVAAPLPDPRTVPLHTLPTRRALRR